MASSREVRNSFCLLSQTPILELSRITGHASGLWWAADVISASLWTLSGSGECLRKIGARTCVGLGGWGNYFLSIDSVKSPGPGSSLLHMWSWGLVRHVESQIASQNLKVEFSALA